MYFAFERRYSIEGISINWEINKGNILNGPKCVEQTAMCIKNMSNPLILEVPLDFERLAVASSVNLKMAEPCF